MRRIINFAAGGYYHIYNRGANRASIFREEENYFYVLGKMKQYSRAYDITLLAYCLPPNHYHFLIRQDGEHPARLLPQYTFNAYTKAFNKRYERSGTLVDRRFISANFDSPQAYQAFALEYLRHRTLPQPLAEYLQVVDV